MRTVDNVETSSNVVACATAISIFATLLTARGLVWKKRSRYFPRLPIFSQSGHLSTFESRTLLIVCLGASQAGLVLGSPQSQSFFSVGTVVWALLAVLFDEHMIQPQLVHFTIATLACGFKVLLFLRLYTCFLYAWGGLQKLNHNFCTKGFFAFFSDAFGRLGIDDFTTRVKRIPFYWTLGLAAGISEAAMGIGLLFARTQIFSASVLCFMHIGILLVIGPLGSKRFVPIWPWNAFCVVLLLELFVYTPPSIGRNLFDDIWRVWIRGSYSEIFFLCVEIVLFGIAPVFSWWERWPPNLSFQMHSSNFPHVTMAYIFPRRVESFDVYSVGASHDSQPALTRSGFFKWASLLSKRSGHEVEVLYSSRPCVLTGQRSTVRRVYGTGGAKKTAWGD